MGFVGSLPIMIVCNRGFQQECKSYHATEWIGMGACLALLLMVASLSGWVGYQCWKHNDHT